MQKERKVGRGQEIFNLQAGEEKYVLYALTSSLAWWKSVFENSVC